MTAKPLLSGLILAVLCTKALAEEPKLQLIDAEKALSDRFGLSTKPVERRDECLPLDSGGGGMRARKVPCEIFEVIRNVEVARTISVDYDKSVTSLPYAREIDSRNIENCLEIEYKHPPADR